MLFYFAVKQKEKQEMLAVCETYATAAQRNQLDPTSYFTSTMGRSRPDSAVAHGKILNFTVLVSY